MKNLFAWASIDENGHASGGKPGDQTGREVKIGYYYEFGQNQVLRFKSTSVGRKAGKYAKALAKNEAIGYSKSQRHTLYNLAKSNGWSYSKLKKALKTTKVNCDCSSFCSTIINLAFGKKVVECDTTATIVSDAMATGNFKTVSVSEAESKWHKGDMPLKAGKHIIINI